VAASTRIIEQVQGDFLEPLGSASSPLLESAAPADVQAALRMAADLLERHVIAAASSDKGETA
jgi:hypothetical protein